MEQPAISFQNLIDNCKEDCNRTFIKRASLVVQWGAVVSAMLIIAAILTYYFTAEAGQNSRCQSTEQKVASIEKIIQVDQANSDKIIAQNNITIAQNDEIIKLLKYRAR